MAGYEGHRGWLNSHRVVDPAHPRRGFGRAILAEGERRLRASGCPKLNLQIRVENEGSIEFYRRNGDSVDREVSMEKRLEYDDRKG
jgi:ribosomal protein S18 acetylase RimI-like enzyme